MTGWRLSPTPQRPTGAVLHRVVADLAQRHIIRWRQPPGAGSTLLGPVVWCGGIGRATVLVVVAPYGHVLALTGTEPGGTLSRAQYAVLDTMVAAGVVALIVHTQPWFDLVNQATTGHAPSRPARATDAAPSRDTAIAAASKGHAVHQEDGYVNG